MGLLGAQDEPQQSEGEYVAAGHPMAIGNRAAKMTFKG